jgi:hypothetical protein
MLTSNELELQQQASNSITAVKMVSGGGRTPDVIKPVAVPTNEVPHINTGNVTSELTSVNAVAEQTTDSSCDVPEQTAGTSDTSGVAPVEQLTAQQSKPVDTADVGGSVMKQCVERTAEAISTTGEGALEEPAIAGNEKTDGMLVIAPETSASNSGDTVPVPVAAATTADRNDVPQHSKDDALMLALEL